jgi:hypothetical protein
MITANRIKNLAITILLAANLISAAGAIYLYTFTTKGRYLLGRAIQQPRGSTWHIHTGKHNLYMQTLAPNGIIMLGNSITYECNWHEIFSRPDIYNRGIPGDKIEGMLERLPALLETNPRQIVLMAGINNLLAGQCPDKTAVLLKELIDKISAETELIVCSTLLTNTFTEVNPGVERLNSIISLYCMSKAIPYLNLNKVLAPEGMLQTSLSYDGLHINAQGYKLWKQELEPLLAIPINTN